MDRPLSALYTAAQSFRGASARSFHLAAVLAQMRAVGVAAAMRESGDVRKGIEKSLRGEKIEPGHIHHAEARRVADIGAFVHLEQLGDARGVLSAFNLAADLAGLKL